MLKQNVIRVPEGCPTINEAMDLAVIFSGRNRVRFRNPVQILVGEGQHVMGAGAGYTRVWTVAVVGCSNVTITGKGKCKTTIFGGFVVNGKYNVKMEQLCVIHVAGYGLVCEKSGTNVDVTECCFKRCQGSGMSVEEGVTVTATRCDFMENGWHGVGCGGAKTKVRLDDSTMHHNGICGLWAEDHAVVDLRGTKTAIHSNKRDGICAIDKAKVNIHLPSQHNTTHDNVEWDRYQDNDGSIANINADGTFTHAEEGLVVVVDTDTDDDEDDDHDHGH